MSHVTQGCVQRAGCPWNRVMVGMSREQKCVGAGDMELWLGGEEIIKSSQTRAQLWFWVLSSSLESMVGVSKGENAPPSDLAAHTTSCSHTRGMGHF